MLYFLSYKMRFQDGTSKVSEAAGARWRFSVRIILGLSWNRLYEAMDFSLKSWTQNFVAGAVLGEFERWLYLLRALSMLFHLWRGSIMRFMLRGRRIIWVTLVAPRIVNDASQVKRINREIHFCVAGAGFGEGGVWLSWQAQHYVVFFVIQNASPRWDE